MVTRADANGVYVELQHVGLALKPVSCAGEQRGLAIETFNLPGGSEVLLERGN